MKTPTKQTQAWTAEYERSGTDRIESSYMPRAEACVAWFTAHLKRQGLVTGALLDLGCGRGRNSLPFLKAGWAVTGVDVAAPALRDFAEAARAHPGSVNLIQRDMGERFPFPEGSFDAVLEITAADNLVNQRTRQRFWRESARVLRPGGWLLTYHFTPQDGYYGPLLETSPRRRRGILYDPRARMHFRFYSAEDVVAASRGGGLTTCRTRAYHHPGPMFGHIVQRDLIAAILCKRDLDGSATRHQIGGA